MGLFNKKQSDKPLTQTEKVLHMLRRAGSHGVTNAEFANHHILRYGAFLKDLRDDGHNIHTHRDLLPNGKVTNVYRYILTEED